MSTSPITAFKNAQGFVAATERKRCGNCQQARETRPEACNSQLQCRKGGFFVSLYAVCDKWEIKQPPGFKAPRPGGAA
jgi:hypothetical protein